MAVWGAPSPWKTTQSADEARPMLDEASALFDRLRARPWLERVERARALDAVQV
jgi:hypothetical protein